VIGVIVSGLIVVFAVVWLVFFRPTPSASPEPPLSPSGPPATSAPSTGGAKTTAATAPAGPGSAAPVPTVTAAGGPVQTSGGDLGKTRVSNGLELTLRSQQCGVAEIKNDYRSVKAIGQFCVYAVFARNPTPKVLTFSLAEISLTGASGRDYTPSVDATLAIDGNDFISEDVPTGGAGTLLVVVDTVATDKPARLVYQGVIVDLDADSAPVEWALPA